MAETGRRCGAVDASADLRVCVCGCSSTAVLMCRRLFWSLAVRQGFVLRNEQRLGLLLPGAPSSRSSSRSALLLAG